jgi:multiple sugar transport system ATP-binding protein
MTHVELRNVSKRYGALAAIKDLNLSVDHGSFTALLGPSGCGKSTLLRMIAGLEDVSAGQVLIGGQDVTDVSPADRGIAMVFQSYALYPHMSVRQNIAFSLRVAGQSKARRNARADEVAATLHLSELLDRKPAQLSGGQRQRVAIGRALVRDPQVFLFDEPLSNLDALLRVQMRLELARLHKELGTTMIYVTHDQVEAMTLADKIVVLDAGRICQVGTPAQLYDQPANRFVAAFVGTPPMNILPVTVELAGPGRIRLVFPDNQLVELPIGSPQRISDLSATQGLELGIRPEHVSLCAPGGGHLEGVIVLVERVGSMTITYVDTAAGQFVVEARGGLEIAPGDPTGLRLASEHLHFFQPDGAAI